MNVSIIYFSYQMFSLPAGSFLGNTGMRNPKKLKSDFHFLGSSSPVFSSRIASLEDSLFPQLTLKSANSRMIIYRKFVTTNRLHQKCMSSITDIRHPFYTSYCMFLVFVTFKLFQFKLGGLNVIHHYYSNKFLCHGNNCPSTTIYLKCSIWIFVY